MGGWREGGGEGSGGGQNRVSKSQFIPESYNMSYMSSDDPLELKTSISDILSPNRNFDRESLA